MVIYLVRHGRTKWSVSNRIQGWLDVPLSKEGREDAVKTAREISKEKFDHIYSSPLKRALETALIIRRETGFKGPVKVLEELKELNQGRWNGLYVWQASILWPRRYRSWKLNPWGVVPPGGEGLKDLKRRVEAAVKIMTREKGNVLVVSHKVVIAMIKIILLKLPAEKIWEYLPEHGGYEKIGV